jgi:hypothetical protein
VQSEIPQVGCFICWARFSEACLTEIAGSLRKFRLTGSDDQEGTGIGGLTGRVSAAYTQPK